MTIDKKIEKYLNESSDAKNIAYNNVISELIPSNIRNPSKYVKIVNFYGNEKYWVIMVKFRDDFYAMDGRGDDDINQMWSGSKRVVVSQVKRDTGVDFSK